jgi:hypothetical protein
VIQTKRDKAGYITEATGVMSELIDWLSIKYNFKSDLLLELIYYADQHLLTDLLILLLGILCSKKSLFIRKIQLTEEEQSVT